MWYDIPGWPATLTTQYYDAPVLCPNCHQQVLDDPEHKKPWDGITIVVEPEDFDDPYWDWQNDQPIEYEDKKPDRRYPPADLYAPDAFTWKGAPMRNNYKLYLATRPWVSRARETLKKWLG